MALNPTDLPGGGLLPGMGAPSPPQMPQQGFGPPQPQGGQPPLAALMAMLGNQPGAQPPMIPPQPIVPPAPPPPKMLHDVTVVTKQSYKCARVEAVPPEEFGISRLAKSMRDCTYCFHFRPTRTEDELIADGYDEDQIHDLETTNPLQSLESLARDTVREQSEGGYADTKGNRPIATTEHYIRLDYLQNGKPKIYKVVTAGSTTTILKRDGKPDIEAVDMMPFAAMTPYIVTHRFYGRSVADMVMDIQRIKTSLLRGALDNIYLANNQRMEIAEDHAGKNTIDDLLTNRPGGIVRTKMAGGLIPIPNSPLGQFVFPMIQYMDGTREWRTGVSQQSMGLDGDALVNQTATAANNQDRAAQARLKLIARIFAETGIRDLFSLLHATIRKNDREDNTVRLRGKWVTVNPRDWKTRNDMTVSVGIGSGTKPEQRAAILQVMDIQKQAMQAPQLGLVKPVNIYNSAKKLVELSGLKTVDTYFTDPSQPQIDPKTGQPIPAPPVPPSPEMMKAQQDAQLAQTKAQQDAQLAQTKAQADVAATQADMQLAETKANAEIALAQRKAQADEQMAMLDYQLRVWEKQQNAQLAASAGIPGKPPNEMINFKDLSPEAQAQMLQQVGISTPPAQPAAPPQPAAPDPQMLAAMDRLAKSHETLAQHLAVANQPKRVNFIRGQDGSISGAEQLPMEQPQPQAAPPTGP